MPPSYFISNIIKVNSLRLGGLQKFQKEMVTYISNLKKWFLKKKGNKIWNTFYSYIAIAIKYMFFIKKQWKFAIKIKGETLKHYETKDMKFCDTVLRYIWKIKINKAI